MAQHGFFGGVQDIFGLIFQGISSGVGGFLYDIFIKGPEDQRRFQQFMADQGATQAQQNEMLAQLGAPQIEFTDVDGNVVFQSDFEGETALDQVTAVGEQTATLAQDFFNPEATLSRFDNEFNPILEQLGGITSDFNTNSANTQAGFGDLLNRARGLVSGLGDQERKDINTRADANASAQQAALADRGLGGTTVTTSQAALSEESRTNQLGRLNERLLREQLGVEQTFGIAGLGFEERTNQFGANLGLATNAAQAGIATNRFNAQDQSQKDLIKLLTEAGLLGPNFQFDLFNSNIAQPPNLQFQSSGGPTFQPGFGNVN